MTSPAPSAPASKVRPVIWTTDADLVLTSLSGYVLVEGDASLRGQPVGTLAQRDAEALIEGSRAALTEGPQTIETDIAGVRHEVTLHPLPGVEGGCAGTVGVALSREAGLEYQTLVEASPYCIHSINVAREFTSINRVGLGMLNETEPEAVLGHPYVSFAHPEDAPSVDRAIDRGFAGESVEFEFRTTDGRTMRSSFVPVRDSAGAVTSLLGFSEDVSPRLEVLARLKQSEERHRILVQKAPYCIHEINNAGCLTSMNPAGLDMMGVDDESAIVGLRYLDIIVDGDRQRISDLLDRALDGEISMFEFEATNGQFFQSNFIPILDQEEKVVRMMGLTQNITEQKHAQRALEASERRLELALQGADLGLWDLDLSTGMLVVNDRWATMIGLDPADAPKRLAARMDRVHPEDLPAVQARLDAHLRGDTEAYASEHRVRSASGDWRWIHERGAVVQRDESGAPVRLTGTCLDLTERHRLAVQLQQSQKMDSIGQLAGGVAHDFNNLLVAILGHTELAVLNLEDAEELYTNLEEIARAARRASELTQRLLVFSRQQRIKRRHLDLNECVDGLLKMLGRLLPETMEVELELSPDLPPVSADPSQLEQVIMNLCVNARDAMPEGGCLTISTRLRASSSGAAGPRVCLEVRDEGVGMSEAVQARMFEPFFTTKSAGSGTGLGLSMVYGIVKQHGGELRVDSELGEGSTFVIELPTATGDAPVEVEAAAPAVFGGRGETILVVEDDELVRKLVVSVLERNGYRVLVAEDGVEALELLETEEGRALSLVLMDVVMPRMGGYQAREEILALRPELEILMTSGYVGSTSPEGDGSTDASPLLAKPYDMGTLLRMLREQLD